MRKLSMVLMMIGVIIIGFAVYQLIDSNLAQKKGLAEAKELVGDTIDPSTPLSDDRSDKEYASKFVDKDEFHPKKGDATGVLNIPKLDAELPIFEGIDETELSRGVGHYPGTAYPEENDQIVLSGHRETVFRGFGDLEIGDTMSLTLPYGVYEYEIVETFIVDADDRTVIVPHDEEMLTVTTCYPFNFIGSAPDRYIINAKPVK